MLHDSGATLGDEDAAANQSRERLLASDSFQLAANSRRTALILFLVTSSFVLRSRYPELSGPSLRSTSAELFISPRLLC